MDPLMHDYPHNSPYAFSENVVISHIELEGAEKLNAVEKAVIAGWVLDYGILNAVEMALKVEEISKYAMDAARNSGLKGIEDGEADAYRHALWNAYLASQIGLKATKDFTTAHEVGSEAVNPNNKEEYNPVAVKMDLFNNVQGRKIAVQVFKENSAATVEDLANAVNQARKDGKLKVIKTKTFNLDVGNDEFRQVELPINKAGNPVLSDNKRNSQLINLLKKNNINVDNDVKNMQLTKSGQTQSKTDVEVDDGPY